MEQKDIKNIVSAIWYISTILTLIVYMIGVLVLIHYDISLTYWGGFLLGIVVSLFVTVPIASKLWRYEK